MAEKGFGTYGAPAPGEQTGSDKLLVQDAENPNDGYNLTLDQLRTYFHVGIPAGTGLTADQRAFLSRYDEDILIPVVTEDPNPLPPTGAPWFRSDTGNFRHAVETAGAASTTTAGTVVFAPTSGGGLVFDSAAGLGSEGGLAEEVLKIGWDSSDPDSFEVRTSNAQDPQGPGLLSVQIGDITVRSLFQLDRTSQGYYEASGQRVDRGDIVAGQSYHVVLTGQRAAFRAETLVASDIGIAGTPGADGDHGDEGWTPQLAIESDGQRRILRVQALVGGTGDKPADVEGRYLGSTGLVAMKADATDVRGAQGPAGTGSGTAVEAATEAEAEAGTEAGKYISPLTLAEGPGACPGHLGGCDRRDGWPDRRRRRPEERQGYDRLDDREHRRNHGESDPECGFGRCRGFGPDRCREGFVPNAHRCL